MRFPLALVFALALASPAHAAMMVNYDLAGLVMQSEAIVVAHRTPGKPSHYRVERAIKGKLAAGTELELDDGLYELDGVDPRVVAFLDHPGGRAEWYLVSAGLRVVADGKVFRFEQWNNPGGFTRVPQGHDPQDNWRTTEQIELATFERELAAATARVDALSTALALPQAKRRSAVLALLPPISAGRGGAGFYVDVLTERAVTELGRLGDVEAALEARRHDHSRIDRARDFAPVDRLLAIAQATGQPVALRREAIESLADHSAYFANEVAVHAMIGLLADPSPAIRAQAVVTAARVWDWASSEPKEAARSKQLARETRAALAKLYASEPENRVLAALVGAFRDRVPERRGGPAVVARLDARGAGLAVEITCLHGSKLAGGKLLATSRGGTLELPGAVTLVCGNSSLGGGSVAGDAVKPGTYSLSVEVTADRKPVTIQLGTLVVAPDGELAID